MAVFIQVLPSEPQATILTDSTNIIEELSSVHNPMILSPSVLMTKIRILNFQFSTVSSIFSTANEKGIQVLLL